MATQPTPIEDRIREAFSDRFRSTDALLGDFLTQSRNAREFVILLCSGLDALANLARLADTQQKRFVAFLYRYSGKQQDLDLVAVPNLYSYLGGHYNTLPATIESPGRLQRFDPRVDDPFLKFVVDSGLPITKEEIGRFLQYFSRVVQRRYRTTATQSREKPVLEAETSVAGYLLRETRAYRRGRYLDAMQALLPVVHDFTIGRLLYSEYRSGAIHEFGFEVDDRFFDEATFYLSTVHRWHQSTAFLEILIPAKWLMSAYKTAVAKYQAQLVRSKKLPADLYWDICDLVKEVKYLDFESLEEGRQLRFSLGR